METSTLYNQVYPHYLSYAKTLWILSVGDYLLIDNKICKVVQVVLEPVPGSIPKIKTVEVDSLSIDTFNQVFRTKWFCSLKQKDLVYSIKLYKIQLGCNKKVLVLEHLLDFVESIENISIPTALLKLALGEK